MGWALSFGTLTSRDIEVAEVIPDDFPDLEKRFGDNPESKANVRGAEIIRPIHVNTISIYQPGWTLLELWNSSEIPLVATWLAMEVFYIVKPDHLCQAKHGKTTKPLVLLFVGIADSNTFLCCDQRAGAGDLPHHWAGALGTQSCFFVPNKQLEGHNLWATLDFGCSPTYSLRSCSVWFYTGQTKADRPLWFGICCTRMHKVCYLLLASNHHVCWL